VIENFFPPSPSDVFVAMAAFLSNRGDYQPLAIFGTALAGGLVGAVGVYLMARRHSRSFGQSTVGRKVLPPEAAAFLLKEYGRYGAFGMFLTRLLPGFRSVVAPFAGLSGLNPAQALVPIALACLVWYGTITWLAARVGAEWETILATLEGINRALGVVALALAAGLAAALVWWRRRARP